METLDVVVYFFLGVVAICLLYIGWITFKNK